MTDGRTGCIESGGVPGLAVLAVLLTCLSPLQAQPVLHLQGEPWFGGDLTLHVSDPAHVGHTVWIALGLDPLPLLAPVFTGKGPWYIGTLTDAFPLGVVPALGRLDLPFTMPPPIAGLEGVQLPVQAYVAGSLSNPATLALDAPSYQPADALTLPHPAPTPGAIFGDDVTAGDLDADGTMDLVVGARFETVSGIEKAGRVYVFWGPDHSTFTVLESPAPAYFRVFGTAVEVADLDGDGLADLAVAEGGGDPPTPGAHGHLHLFRGGGTLARTPWQSIPSAGTGLDGYDYARTLFSGDLDGDGAQDLVATAQDAKVAGFDRAGRLEVFFGPLFSTAVLIENPEPKALDFFGSSISLADVTGDGRPDIVESSGRAKIGVVTQAGRAHVFDGPTLTLLATLDNPWPAANDRFGEGLHAADLDADGSAEIILADVKKNIYVAWDVLAGGTVSAWVKPPTPNPTSAASSYGYFFSAMDANLDGRMDIVIADPFEGDAVGCGVGSAGGAVYIALAPYYSTFSRIGSPDPQCGDNFGWHLATADLDGDGRAEVLAGNGTADPGGIINAGKVLILIP